MGRWQLHQHSIKTETIGNLAEVLQSGGRLVAHHALKHAIDDVATEGESKRFADHLQQGKPLLYAALTENRFDLKTIGVTGGATLFLTQGCCQERFTIRVLPVGQFFNVALNISLERGISESTGGEGRRKGDQTVP